MNRVMLFAAGLVFAFAAFSFGPPSHVAIAAGGADVKTGPAGVGPIDFPCEEITFTGTTTDAYFSERSTSRHLFTLTSDFHGAGTGSYGYHLLKIHGSGIFTKPSGHDSTGDYFDFHYVGSVTGPEENYKVTGTWRVWVKNDHVVADTLLGLTLNGATGPTAVIAHC